MKLKVIYLSLNLIGLQQLKWWVKAWRLSGLDEPEEAFDIILFTHPEIVPKVTDIMEESDHNPFQVEELNECTVISESFNPRFEGSGTCFFKPYIGFVLSLF